MAEKGKENNKGWILEEKFIIYGLFYLDKRLDMK